MQYSNYHTHTNCCDGIHSVEEIVEKAIELGCPEIGFSGHSFMDFHPKSFAMSRESTNLYRRAIVEAQKKYGDQIKIYAGIEQEYYSSSTVSPYDYVIGSVHFVKKEGGYLAVDLSARALKEGVDRYYGGDFISLAKDYYALVASVFQKTNCQIVGHFDLISKFNEKNPLFDENDPAYKKIALEALEKLSEHKLVYEINSGAISRGYRTSPYPAPFLLDAMAALRLPVVFSSDSHQRETLLFGFEKMSELAKAYKLTVMDNMKDILDYTR